MDRSDDSDDILLQNISIAIGKEFLGERIDKALAELVSKFYPELLLTRSKIERAIENGSVKLEGVDLKNKSFKIERECLAEIFLANYPDQELKPDPDVHYEVVFEDNHLVVINKPAGLIVHPGDGGEVGTLSHGLVSRYGLKGVGHPKRPGIVHRLDKDTSGLMVVARDQSTLVGLLEQFHPPRKIHRTYLAFTRKAPTSRALLPAGVISASIARDPKNPVKMTVAKEGRAATTRYQFVEEFSDALLLELELETGRTHQIRVHLENIGIPILGDQTYNRGSGKLSNTIQAVLPKRQALHAAKLSFEHPITKEPLCFEAKLPEDLANLLGQLRAEYGA